MCQGYEVRGGALCLRICVVHKLMWFVRKHASTVENPFLVDLLSKYHVNVDEAVCSYVD